VFNGGEFPVELNTIPTCAFQVGPKGKVIGIDHIKELVDDSINNVKKDDPSLITSGRVKLLGKLSRMKHGIYLYSILQTLLNSAPTLQEG